jgi:hypothetical protein
MVRRMSCVGGISQAPVGLDHNSVGSQERHAFCAVATNLFAA